MRDLYKQTFSPSQTDSSRKSYSLTLTKLPAMIFHIAHKQYCLTSISSQINELGRENRKKSGAVYFNIFLCKEIFLVIKVVSVVVRVVDSGPCLADFLRNQISIRQLIFKKPLQ